MLHGGEVLPHEIAVLGVLGLIRGGSRGRGSGCGILCVQGKQQRGGDEGGVWYLHDLSMVDGLELGKEKHLRVVSAVRMLSTPIKHANGKMLKENAKK